MRKLKIVHIITRLIIGGAQENTLLSCEGQHDLGHDVTLLSGPAIGPEGSLVERARAYGYRVEILDTMRRSILPVQDLFIYRSLVKLLKELQPDVVHTHSSKAGIIGRWAAHRAKVPAVVHTIHGLSWTASTLAPVNATYRWLEKITAPVTGRIVCVADAMRDQSLARGLGEASQYVTVYSGMSTAVFVNPPVARDVVRKQLGLSDDHIAVGTIARLFDLKGHEDLLEFAPQLCAKYPNLRFLWVGDGSRRAEFEKRIAQMNLKDRFILTGLVPPTRIPELCGAMDVVVHPSRREGLARALAQGALARCPVVTYDIDGNREALIEGETGYLIQPFNTEMLKLRLMRLLDDPVALRHMGERGRAFALARFDTQAMVDGLERVYADLLREKGEG